MSPDAESASGALPAIGDVARAIGRASRWTEISAIVAAAVGGAFLSVLLAIGIGFTPFHEVWTSFPLPWLSLNDLAFALILGVAWAAASVLLLPRRLLPAFEAFVWSGERGLEAWRAATGTSMPPTSIDGANRWLEANPPTEANQFVRIEALLLVRDFATARSAIDALPTETAEQRVLREDYAATLDMMETGRADLRRLRAAAEEATGDVALDGLVAAALLESRMAVARGEDWQEPLAAVRPRLGAGADGVLWRGYARRRLMVALPLLLLGAAAIGVLRALTGGA
jgi:hypothetical protein